MLFDVRFVRFVFVLILNGISPWGIREWNIYYIVTMLAIPFVVGIITSVWFFIGGVIDLRYLFRDLEARKRDFSDDGRVEKTE